MFKARKTKYIISLLSALIIFYNSSGYVLIFQSLIQFTKFFNHAAIEKNKVDEEIILLTFDKSEIIDMEKDGKELRYQDDLYDIVSKYETEDSVFIYCYYDYEENLLENNFHKHYQKEKQDQKKRPRQFLTLFSEKDLLSEFNFNLQHYEVINNYLTKIYFSNYQEIPSPPPRLKNLSRIFNS